jgi:hypothetical protein
MLLSFCCNNQALHLLPSQFVSYLLKSSSNAGFFENTHFGYGVMDYATGMYLFLPFRALATQHFKKMDAGALNNRLQIHFKFRLKATPFQN